MRGFPSPATAVRLNAPCCVESSTRPTSTPTAALQQREAWLLNRSNVQPTLAFLLRTLAAMTAELEAARVLQRIDTTVQPTMYRCAIVCDAELAQLRRIRHVMRLRRGCQAWRV